MAHATDQPDTMHVAVSDDRLTATLCIPQTAHAAVVTLEHAQRLLSTQHVPWTDDVRAAVEHLLTQSRAAGAVRAVVASGVAPQPGSAGRVEWAVDQDKPPADAQRVSHYERCAFLFVETGQCLGRIVPPTPGIDGVDVTGQVIPAPAGAPIELQLDESITRKPGGELIANRHGRLVRTKSTARVHELLEVPTVDFSTGNIDFRGSILIRDGVKDCFIVKATECIEAHGLIEAAEFHCGGDLIFEGGFAGREQGSAHVGRDFHARYLDGVTADVRGDLVVAREVINCDLTVHGNADIARGALIGGRFVVAGSLRVGNLGSGGGVHTEVVVGCVPRLDPTIAQLDDLRRGYRREIKAVEQKRNQIATLGAGDPQGTTNQRRLGKFVQVLDSLHHQLQRADTAAQMLRQKVHELRIIDVHVLKTLHEGVVIRWGDTSFRVFQPLVGPLTIAVNKDGHLVFRSSRGTEQSLATVAEPQGPRARPAA